MTEQRERVAEFTHELREGPEPSDRSVKEIVDALRPQIQELVSKQVELAKTELAPVGKRAGLGVGLLVGGAVFMFVFTILISFTVAFAIAVVLPYWLSFLIVSAILLVFGGILAGAGASSLRKVDPVPRRTVQTMQQNIDWLKGQLRR